MIEYHDYFVIFQSSHVCKRIEGEPKEMRYNAHRNVQMCSYLWECARFKNKKKIHAIPYEPARRGCSRKYLRAGDNEQQFCRGLSRANS